MQLSASTIFCCHLFALALANSAIPAFAEPVETPSNAASREHDGPASGAAVPQGSGVPPSLAALEPLDRLLTCKAAFVESVERHLEASRGLASPDGRVAAHQAATNQALAVAVLEDAEPDAEAPQARHVRLAVDKQQRTRVLSYCRRIVGQYVDAQQHERPRYLLELKEIAEAIVTGLEEPQAPKQAQ